MARPSTRRGTLLPALCTVASLVRAAAAAGPADPREALARADALHARSEYGKVLELLAPLEGAAGLAPEEKVRLFTRLALAHTNLSQHEAAGAAADRAEAVARLVDDPAVRGRVAHLRGEVARRRGSGYEAISHYRGALEWGRRAGDAALVARAYNGLAAAHQQLGDWARVLDYTRRAFEALPPADDAARSRHLFALGVASYEFRERDAAERHFRDLLEHAERTGRRSDASLAHGELGLLYWEFDRDRRRALEHDERALALAREVGDVDLEATWLLNSGNVFRDAGDLEEALRRYRRGLELEEKTGRRGVYPTLLKNVGQVLAQQGRHGEAERWLLRAREDADRLGRQSTRWEARMELGRLYAAVQPELADAPFRESLDLIEQHHSNILLEGFRIGALSRTLDKYDPYDLYVDFLLDQGREEDAFLVAERARSRAFLDTLAAAREEIASAVPEGYREREDALLARISSRQARLRAASLDPAPREELRGEVAAAEADLAALRLRLAVDRPAVAHARYPQVPGVRDLQARTLRPGEALLIFHLGRRASAAWVVTADRLHVRRLPARAVLEPAAREHVRFLARPGRGDGRQQAAALSRVLEVDAIAELLPADGRLVVVPHGVLHHVPVETLVTRDGRYLVERFVVSYAPSASSLSYLRQKGGRTEEGTLVAIGDPLAADAPPAGERSIRLETLARLKPLPHSGRELRRVASLFAGPAVLERERATEERLRQTDLAGAAILHFATHGVIDEERPDRSGLALTAAPPQDDGLLQMNEIYRMRLRAALVTLSACESALGRQATGEGMVGLARAFFYAGADAVLASLWSVDDLSTSDWMVRFYGEVRAGLFLDHAAQKAKLAFLHGGGRLQHPYYWAPFVLTGQAAVVAPVRPAPLLSGRAVAATVLVVAGLAASASVLVRLHRRRQRGAVARTG